MTIALGRPHAKQNGFTVVELMVVLVVIGLLAGLSVFAYGAWRKSVAKTEVTSDLINVVAAMNNAKNFDNGYPALTGGSVFDETGPSENTKLFTSSPGVTVVYQWGDVYSFCIDASSKSHPEVHYFVDTANGTDPVFGTCATGEEDESSPSLPSDNVAYFYGKLSAGGDTSCAITSDDKAYCWGANDSGQAGVGSTTSPLLAPTLVAQGSRPDQKAKSIDAGERHSCLVGSDDRGYCFGARLQLGLSTGQLGDNSASSSPATINAPNPITAAGELLGGKIKAASTNGSIYTCAVGLDKYPYCWGTVNSNQQLGTTKNSNRQDTPVRVLENGVLTGKTIKQLSSAYWHSCVIASDDWVYCWGSKYRIGISNPGFASGGQLVTPVERGEIPLGARIAQVSAIGTRTCVVSVQNRLYCWGELSDNTLDGHLGRFLSGTSSSARTPVAVNLAELPNSGKVRQVTLGESHICVLSTNDKVYCAGKRDGSGKLGDALLSGDSQTAVEVARGEMPADATVKYIMAGINHTCLLASNGKLYCWGKNNNGQLGNGTTTDSAVPVEVKNLPAISL